MNTFTKAPISELPSKLLADVKTKLGIPTDVRSDINGLRAVYAAWCAKMPFDNVRKMIALSKTGETLPGLDAVEYFECWLEHGTGGTCWPSSNALCVLLQTLGFDARRVAGSMYDLGVINHGTVKVRIDGQDWLTDTSMMTGEPLPVNDDVYIDQSGKTRAEVEPVDDTHIIWADFVPTPVYIPCRLHTDHVDTAFYAERYEIFSREFSPFNKRLYLRRAGERGASVILGNTEFRRVRDGVEVREFDRDQLCEHLTVDAGISSSMVERWASSGGLDSSFDPANLMDPPPISGVRPSLRL